MDIDRYITKQTWNGQQAKQRCTEMYEINIC